MELIPFISTSSCPPQFPLVIFKEGEKCWDPFLEFFTARIRNLNTRKAYYCAVKKFLDWCDQKNLSLHEIKPSDVASYIENHKDSLPTQKQHLAAIKNLFDYLVVKQVLSSNPASPVRGPRYSQKQGKTPVLSGEDALRLLNSIDPSTVMGARDRALIALMIYSFARISAVLSMRVCDYIQIGKYYWVHLHEKRGKFHKVPLNRKAHEYLEHYIELAHIKEDRNGPLFRSMLGKTQILKPKALSRYDANYMIQRRAKKAGLGEKISCHTFRATGITAYLRHGGTLENAQKIAAHDSPRTTKLYDRTDEDITLDEIERIIL